MSCAACAGAVTSRNASAAAATATSRPARTAVRTRAPFPVRTPVETIAPPAPARTSDYGRYANVVGVSTGTAEQAGGERGPWASQARQEPRQGAERLAPVADRVLLLRRQLRVGPGLPLPDEDRVVTEPAGAPRLADEPAHLALLDQLLGAVGQHERGRAHERRPPVLV